MQEIGSTEWASQSHLRTSVTILGRAGAPVTCWNKAQWNYYSINEKKKSICMSQQPWRGLREVLKASRWEQHFHTKERRKHEWWVCVCGGGSGGEERGETGGVRGVSGWQRRPLKLCRSLGTSEPCSTPPLLLYSSPSPSMWGKSPGVTAMRFPWALTCGPLTLLRNVLHCCYSALCGIFMQNKIIFCRGQKQ